MVSFIPAATSRLLASRTLRPNNIGGVVTTAARGVAAVATSNPVSSSNSHVAGAPVPVLRLSSVGQEAACRLKDALEQYRVKNFAAETPWRFKKQIASACVSPSRATASTSPSLVVQGTVSDKAIAVNGIENMLRNIGALGDRVTRDDVETIVTEIGGGGQNTEEPEMIRADKIILEVLKTQYCYGSAPR